MKKILINLLALSVLTTGIVACGSGGSSSPNNAPAAPAVTPVTAPFPVPANSTSGAAFNVASKEIALPLAAGGATGYVTYSMPTALSSAIELAGVDETVVTTSGNNIVVSVPVTPATIPATRLTYVLTPPAGTLLSQSLQATVNTTAESYTYLSSLATTNLIAIESSGTAAFPAGLVFGTAESIVVQTPNPTAESFNISLTRCDGVVTNDNASTISATKTQGVVYLSFGTQTGKVCVLSGATALFTNISAQAPAKYTPGNVNSFGFPASLNTGNTLVGYWNVGDIGTEVNLYRVTGTYNNGTPTGNGFLNTTQAGSQTTTNGTTKVTFTGFPSPASIYSSYTDSVGNLWVGTNAGAVYVLRTGATQWTNTTLTGATSVTVQTNGATSGATATTLIGGASQSFAVN